MSNAATQADNIPDQKPTRMDPNRTASLKSQEAMIERSHRTSSADHTDFVLSLFLLPALYTILPVAAFDSIRLHWTSVPAWGHMLGNILLLIGFGMIAWAESVNRFLKPGDEVHPHTGQSLVCTGPYAIVRHPGNAGLILLAISVPLCFNSLLALVPAGLSSLLILLRTQREDRTLKLELSGYRDYALRVGHKMMPGLW